MNWLQKIFTGSVDGTRVNLIGVAVMAIGLLGVLLAPRIAKKIGNGEKNIVNAVKLIGMIICAAGTLIAILA